jgi:membrane protein required for colicin V production
MALTPIDWFIVALTGLGMARGFVTGGVRQLLGLVGVVAAVVVGISAMESVGRLIAESLKLSPRVGPLLGFGAVFIAVQLVVWLIIQATEALLGAVKLSLFNRLLGLLVGGLKAVLLLSLLFLILHVFDWPKAATRKASLLYEPVATVLPATWDFVAARAPEARRLVERFAVLTH